MNHNRLVQYVSMACWLLAMIGLSLVQPLFSWCFPALRITLKMRVLPLLGRWVSGPWALVGSGLAWLSLRYLLPNSVVGPALVATGIPTMLATLSFWASKRETRSERFVDYALHIGFCALAMAYFAYAAPSALDVTYVLFWVLPMVGLVLQSRSTSLLVSAIKSTFVAHAAGSIIHLALRPGVAGSWYSLIPTVCLERAMMVGMTVVACCVIQATAQALVAYSSKHAACYGRVR